VSIIEPGSRIRIPDVTKLIKPHGSDTLMPLLLEGGDIPAEFSRPEVLGILRKYYASIAEGD